jgi:flagellar hook-associated protein 3 FlgL
MRIATSTIYSEQTAAIENLAAQYQDIGQQLSTGKSLNFPSDAPTDIGLDLSTKATISLENQADRNLRDTLGELTTTDSSLGSLTSIIQSARQLAIQGATDTLTPTQRLTLSNQADALLSQAIGVANTSYGGKFVFAGSAQIIGQPVKAIGSPTAAVSFSGNFETSGQLVVNSQQFPLTTTLRDGFNYAAPDGSSDVFSVLRNLRDSLKQGTVVDQSQAQLNVPGTVINPISKLNAIPLANKLTTALPGPVNQVAFAIDGHDTSGNPQTAYFTFDSTVDSINSVVTAINAQTATVGVTAAFNAKTQKLVLSGGPFRITDGPALPNVQASNFTQAFGLTNNADAVQTLSTQLGDIDKVLNVNLTARAAVGMRIQTLSSIADQNAAAITDNTKIKSQIEDANIAKLSPQFVQTQTALNAAYATTVKLEGKTLMDYLG